MVPLLIKATFPVKSFPSKSSGLPNPQSTNSNLVSELKNSVGLISHWVYPINFVSFPIAACKAGKVIIEFSLLATWSASYASPGEPTTAVSLTPFIIYGSVDVAELPAETTHITPSSVAFLIATCSGSSGSLYPAVDPKDIFIISASNSTDDSNAAIISSE